VPLIITTEPNELLKQMQRHQHFYFSLFDVALQQHKYQYTNSTHSRCSESATCRYCHTGYCL